MTPVKAVANMIEALVAASQTGNIIQLLGVCGIPYLSIKGATHGLPDIKTLWILQFTDTGANA